MQLGILTFRFRPARLPEREMEGLQRRMVARMLEDGYAMVTSTTVRGRTVLRLCPIHPQAGEADVRETLRRLVRFGEMG